LFELQAWVMDAAAATADCSEVVWKNSISLADIEGLSQVELECLLVCHGVDQDVDAGRLQADSSTLALLEKPLGRCAVCLTTDGFAPTSTSSADGNTNVDNIMRCGSCLRPFHKVCVGQHALSSAETGRVPMRCPVPQCSKVWPRNVLSWALCLDHLAKYDKLLEMILELQTNQGGDQASASLSPRSAAALKSLGIRNCPRCQMLLQKQAEGLLSGCDKMTCRCGCMFCFQCGTEARAGGIARCRCVGTHHNFISHKEVLDNYAGTNSGGLAADQDLTKRPKGPASPLATARLNKELKTLVQDPPPYVHVVRERCNVLRWNFIIEGPPETPYDGGWYWGRLELPRDYPHFPPLIRMLTPSGRFQVDTWLCRTTLDYHPEGWQATWGVASLLIALLALMCDDSFTPGAVHPPISDQEIKRLAQQSLLWNMEQRDFTQAFPSIEQLVFDAAERRRADGLPQLPTPGLDLLQTELGNHQTKGLHSSRHQGLRHKKNRR